MSSINKSKTKQASRGTKNQHHSALTSEILERKNKFSTIFSMLSKKSWDKDKWTYLHYSDPPKILNMFNHQRMYIKHAQLSTNMSSHLHQLTHYLKFT